MPKGASSIATTTAFGRVRDQNKYDNLLSFAKHLPRIRSTVSGHLALRGLPREKVLATVVSLLETTLIRVGSDEYARTNKSYGLTTLTHRHVDVAGGAMRFNFKGKSGKIWRVKVQDRRIAKVVRACQELPGQELFQYVDEGGTVRDVTSTDVNAYLREVGALNVSTKDFRTWHGTVLAAVALQATEKFDSETAAKRNIRSAILSVASRLGNTPAVCRKCYIHPEIFAAYAESALILKIEEESDSELRPEETAVLALLTKRLGTSLKDKLKASVSQDAA